MALLMEMARVVLAASMNDRYGRGPLLATDH